MAISSNFSPSTGVLTTTGDGLDNEITASRDAAGNILVNGGAVPIAGGTATVANTTLIQAFGQDGNDTIALDETNGALPNAALFGGNGNDMLIGGSGNDVVVGGAGSDTALLGAGNDTFFWNPGDGSDVGRRSGRHRPARFCRRQYRREHRHLGQRRARTLHP